MGLFSGAVAVLIAKGLFLVERGYRALPVDEVCTIIRQIADAVEGLGSDSRGAVARSERARRRLHDAFGYSSWLSAVDGVYASLE